MNKMKIDIWSDIACPYCYIGLNKLQKALDNFPHKDKVELAWHSYELNPEFPKDSSKIEAENKAQSHAELVSKLGAEVDIKFDFDKLIMASTLDALRLVKLANTKGLATQMEDALFKSYFTEGKDISDNSVLIAVGKQVGLSESEIKQLLDGNQYEKGVKDDFVYADETLDLEYIPYYLFNNEHIVQGSIATEDYATLLEKSYKEWTERGVSDKKGDTIDGQACSIDGVCS